MKTALIFFSSTGNGLSLVRHLGEELKSASEGVEVLSIADLLEEENIEINASRVGLVFPVYCFGLPSLVIKFLKRVQFIGHPYIFGIIHCASMVGCASYQLRKELKDRGYHVSLVKTIKMPANYTPLHGAESNSRQEKKFVQAKTVIQRLALDVQHNRKISGVTIFFFINGLMAKMQPWVMKWVAHKENQFFVNDTCTACGDCIRVCPVGNLRLSNGKIHWQGHCEHCMACLQWCPVEAIQFTKVTQKRKRYHHPEISLNDLVRHSRQ